MVQYKAWLPHWAELGMLVWAREWLGKKRVWWPVILRPHGTQACKDQHVWVFNLGSHDWSEVKSDDLLPFTGAHSQ